MQASSSMDVQTIQNVSSVKTYNHYYIDNAIYTVINKLALILAYIIAIKTKNHLL